MVGLQKPLEAGKRKEAYAKPSAKPKWFETRLRIKTFEVMLGKHPGALAHMLGALYSKHEPVTRAKSLKGFAGVEKVRLERESNKDALKLK